MNKLNVSEIMNEIDVCVWIFGFGEIATVGGSFKGAKWVSLLRDGFKVRLRWVSERSYAACAMVDILGQSGLARSKMRLR